MPHVLGAKPKAAEVGRVLAFHVRVPILARDRVSSLGPFPGQSVRHDPEGDLEQNFALGPFPLFLGPDTNLPHVSVPTHDWADHWAERASR